MSWNPGSDAPPWLPSPRSDSATGGKINDLEITTPQGEILRLSPGQRQELAEALENQAEMTFAGILRILKLKTPKGSE